MPSSRIASERGTEGTSSITMHGLSSCSTTSKTDTAFGCWRRAVIRASRMARCTFTSPSVSVNAGLSSQLLDRHRAGQPLVARLPDDAHAAGADLSHQAVAIGDESPWRSHRPPLS